MSTTKRRDRSTDSRDDLMREIEFAENILDAMNAKSGLTLWGRIASIKDRIEAKHVKEET